MQGALCQRRHRDILMSWLVEVQGEFKMDAHVFHTAMSLVDHVWAVHPCMPSRRIQASNIHIHPISEKQRDMGRDMGMWKRWRRGPTLPYPTL